ncbi:MAG TPA: protein kinase [Polyangiaceae bacterium]|nr:protein kinase [Polyangiaceae bacterium]
MSEPAVAEEPKSAREPRSARLPAPPAVNPGQIIGERYRVDEPIGEGGMGVVCRATHLTLDTPVAIKLIRPDFKDDGEFVRRFLNEARRAALLKSERITRVHDVGQLESGEPYLVMELLEGIELEKFLEERGWLAPLDAVNIALQICEGLAEAHAAGIVHRDIKPGNAFLVRRADGRFGVKILDFGISKQIDGASTSITNHDQSLGSPQYMSPEQMLDPSSVDHRSDIWSVGVVLFELLSGKRPFDGASMPEVCAKVLTAPAPLLRTLRPDIDPELEAIVMQCLEKKPDARYRDVAALGQALQRFACIHATSEPRVVETTAFFEPVVDAVAEDLGSLPPLARSSAPPPRRSQRAHWAGALGVAAVMALTGVALGRAMAVGGTPRPFFGNAAATPVLASGPAPAPPVAETRTYPFAFEVAGARAAPERERPGGAAAEDEAAPTARADEAALTPAEIRRRIERYQRWLDAQGLMRLDASDDEPSYMKEP